MTTKKATVTVASYECFPVSARISAWVRSRSSPGRMPFAVIVPIRVRLSRATGWAMASHMYRTCRLRPSRITSSTRARSPSRVRVTPSSFTRAFPVRRPSIVALEGLAIYVAIVVAVLVAGHGFGHPEVFARFGDA